MVLELQDFIYRFLFAILVGALVGLEREHMRHSKQYKGIPIFGLRTTILFSILGFFFAFIALYLEIPYLLSVGVLAALFITTTVYISNVWVKHYTGSTTYITMLIVFFLGALAGMGGYTNFMIAAIGSIVTTAFLAGKSFLIGITKKLKREEIFAAVKFGIIAFIILPLLPNRALDPIGIFNPFKIWYVIVLVSAIYFVSYLLMKFFSEKGLLISAIFGGLISGSITTFQLSGWLRKNKKLVSIAATGVFLAIITGILSDIFSIIFVFQTWDLLLMILPFQAMGVIFLLFLAFINYKEKKKIPKFKLKLHSPFAFKPALTFGAFYLGFLAINAVVGNLLGIYGMYPIAILASLVSSSAFIISTAGLYSIGQIGLIDATKLIVVSTIVAFVIKIFWVQNSKNKSFVKKIAISTLIGSVLMAITVLIQLFFF